MAPIELTTSDNPPPPVSLGAVLPAVLLPALLVLGYYIPQLPFRLRPTLFLAALAALQYASFTSPWPANVGDQRALRYGVASSWIFVLPVVERITLHIPERDFRRVDPDDLYHKACPPDWSWRKLWWAVRLVATPRGVGWNFGGRGVNSQREVIRAERRGRGPGRWYGYRGGYVARCVGVAGLCYLVWDAVMLAERKTVTPEQWVWDVGVLGRIAYAELRMGLIVYCGMTLQFSLAAVVGVGLGLNEPEDWPRLFGSLGECFTTANVWGRFWHQYIRQPCLGISHRLIQGLGIPRRSRLAYLVHLANAFVISDLSHILAVGAMAKGFYPLTSVISDLSVFFLVQPAAAMVEGAAMALFARYCSPGRLTAPPAVGGNAKDDLGQQRQEQDQHEQPAGESSASGATTSTGRGVAVSTVGSLSAGKTFPMDGCGCGTCLVQALCRLAGYVWVVLWFFVTGWWFVKAYLGVRMQDWKLPYSILEKLLLP